MKVAEIIQDESHHLEDPGKANDDEKFQQQQDNGQQVQEGKHADDGDAKLEKLDKQGRSKFETYKAQKQELAGLEVKHKIKMFDQQQMKEDQNRVVELGNSQQQELSQADLNSQ